MQSSLMNELISRLGILPGVGQKTAQRMALYLIEHNRAGAKALATTLLEACDTIQHCKRCRNLTESTLCAICQNPHRQKHQLCVVETPADLVAIEKSGVYQGDYFILMGKLSPLDGIGPEELGIADLVKRIEEGVTEVILATNPTVEGDVTAQFIIDQLQPNQDLTITRIAHGIPIGGEIEYSDGNTLAHALTSRKTIS